MKPLREVLEGPFAEWLGTDDWRPWTAFLMALNAERMTARERRIYQACTGRQALPRKPFNEAWVIVGRRGRKSATAAVLGVYCAVYGKWRRAAGETVRVLIVAVSKDQAKLVRNYCEAILESRPGLARLIKASDAESITLTNGIQIVCVANSYRSIRGPTVVCAIFEELAFWYSDDSANPDKEVLRAVRPSMLTVPGALLLGISSPYAKRGLLYEKYREHYGRDDSKVLVWKASTEFMNPQVDAEIIQEAYTEDPVAAAAEYGGDFRTDLESYVSREAVDAVVSRGVFGRDTVDHPLGGHDDLVNAAMGALARAALSPRPTPKDPALEKLAAAQRERDKQFLRATIKQQTEQAEYAAQKLETAGEHRQARLQRSLIPDIPEEICRAFGKDVALLAEIDD